jgi:WD40 repeat protein
MNERSIFIEALEKPTAAERTAYLDEACGADTALRQRVEALLQSHQGAGAFLDKLAPQRLAEELTATEKEKPNTELLDFLTASSKPGSLGRLGHYEVLEVVGRGGMGVVCRAFDETLHRVVAIKAMAAELAVNPTARQRFTREAQAAAAVCHDHVVTIHAVDDVHRPPYLVMQYVEGVSLQDKLDRGGPLGLREILRIGMQAAAGLAAAHAQGLVHRDIKPANILLENGVERVKITDFGLARAAGDGKLTGSGVVAGTPQYMAPEQARGDSVDYRCDLFSLGSVLYALCTGRPPFAADNAMAVLRKVCDETPVPIRDINPQIPPWLVAVVARLQAKNPAERFPSAAEVGKLLGEHLARVQQPTAGAEAGPLEATFSQPAAGRRRYWVGAALLLVLAGLALSEATGTTRLTATVLGLFELETDPSRMNTVNAGPKAISARGVLDQLEPAPIPAAELLDWQPKDLLAVLGENRQRHWDAVLCVACSPDGKLVASGGLDRRIVIADAATMRPRMVLRHTQNIHSVAFAPDSGSLLSSDAAGKAILWDVATGKERLRLEGLTSLTPSICFAPDGHRALTASHDGLVRLWDVDTGKELKRFAGHKGQVISVAFAPDGDRAVSGGYDHTARVWDLKTDKELCCFEGHPGVVNAVAFLPDGRHAISSNGHQYREGRWGGARDYWVRLWDATSGQELQHFKGHEDGLTSLVLSSDGSQALSGSADATVRLWDVATGQEKRCLRGHEKWVTCVAFPADQRQAISGGSDGRVRRWDLESAEELDPPAGHRGGPIGGVAFSPDGRYLLSGAWHDKSLRLWDLSTCKEVRTFEGHTKGGWCVAFSKDGQSALSGSADSTMRLWDVASGKELRKFEGHTGWVVSIGLSPDGSRALTGAWGNGDYTVRSWDLASGKELDLPFRPVMGGISVAYTPDGRKVLTGGLGKTVSLWDVASGAELLSFQGHTAAIVCVAIAPDGLQAVSCGHDSTVWLWSLTADGKPGRKFLKYHTGEVRCVAFAPDGKTVVSSGTDGRVILWDVATGDRIQDWQFPVGWLCSVAFAPDGRHLAAGNGNGTIYILRPVFPRGEDRVAECASIPPREQKRPVRSSRQARSSPARPSPGARSARPDTCRF